MCEMFGVSGKSEINVHQYLSTFVSHGVDHPNGWGLAVFRDTEVNLEKEPVCSNKSRYLRERLKHPMIVTELFAHIRYATKGNEVSEG